MKQQQSNHSALNPVLKLVLELGPLSIFFFVNARGEALMQRFPVLTGFGEPIFMATAVFMVAILLSLAISFIIARRVPVMPLITGLVVLVFGGLTLFLQDDTFIKIKPTLVNVLFGSILLAGLAFNRSFLAYVFDGAFHLTAQGWRILTWRWGIFFFILALLNEMVWRTQSTDFWVAFKVWGIMPLTFIFALCQIGVMQRYADQTPSPSLPSS